METSQLVLSLVVAVLGSGGVATAATLYFTRRKTEAEAHHKDAETSGAYVDQVQSTIDRLVQWMPKFEAATAALVECMKGRAEAEIGRQEALADNKHLEATLKMLGEENKQKDAEITKLREELKEARGA